jgi:alcohol dehydrogenase class IV
MQLVATALGAERTADARSAARYALEEVTSLVRALGLPLALCAIGVGKDDLPALADECYEKYPRPQNPRQYSRDDLFHLYEQLWSGKLDF